MKAWRYRFKLTKAGETKESVFAIGDYAHAPPGETGDQTKARRDGRRFTLAEARDERTKARALVKQGINPAHIVSFDQLRALMQRHRSKVRGVSRDAEFLRWLMDREWSRLEAGSGFGRSD